MNDFQRETSGSGEAPSRRTGWRYRATCAAFQVFAALVMCNAHAQGLEWVSVDYGRPSSFSYADGLLAYAVGGYVYVQRSTEYPYEHVALPSLSGSEGTPALTSLPTAGDLERKYVFAGGETGWLTKLDLELSADAPDEPFQVAVTAGVTQQRDMRRGICGFDTLRAGPVVQRRADSNAQYTFDKDIVIIGTAHGCNDTTANQIIALDAANIMAPPLWIFNFGEYEVGAIRFCLPDLARNRVYCGAEHPEGSFQAALWAIDTNTGSLVWAAVYDAQVHGVPALGSVDSTVADHLYVGDSLGRVHVIDPDSGEELWATPAFPPSTPIEHDLAVGSGDFANVVFVAADAIVVALYDAGDELIETWSSFPMGQVISAPVPMSSIGRLFAVTDDGRFQQIAMSTGATETSIALGSPLDTFEISSLYAYKPTFGPHRLVGTAYTADTGITTQQYRVPCVYNSHICYAEDGDGVSFQDGDNCPWVANPEQTDSDGDNVGDACDVCPLVMDFQLNNDLDALGDFCDTDDDNDGITDEGELEIYFTKDRDPDTDNDDYSDGLEILGGSDPFDPSSFPPDINDDDGDGVLFPLDNCSALANADQSDTDADGIGNLCDADLNNDCIVNFSDLGELKSLFFSGDPDADFNGDGIVNFVDLGVLKGRFFLAPGPSGQYWNVCQGT